MTSRNEKKLSAVHFSPVLYAVDGYGFGLVVDVVQYPILTDSKPISVNASEFFGFVLSRLFGKRLDLFVKDSEVLRTNGTQVFLNSRLGKKRIHYRRLDFFKRDSISA